MGRTRGFEDLTTLRAAAEVFCLGGYEGTSVDDLVTSLGIHRGSLYNAYGSKRGLFLAALRHHVDAYLTPPSGGRKDADRRRALDLLMVAAVERGHRDDEVAEIVREALTGLDEEELPPDVTPPGPATALLADQLRRRLDRDGDLPGTTSSRSADGNGQR